MEIDALGMMLLKQRGTMAPKVRLTLALAASLPLAACASEAGIAGVANTVALKAGGVFVASIDKGAVTVKPGTDAQTGYRVEFKRDRSLSERFGFGKGEAAGCAECAADYTPAGGLSVRTGKGVSALVELVVPASQDLKVDLEVGTLHIGRVAGKLAASVETGTLDYDASGLPAGACVDASVKVGAVDNAKDVDCKSTAATLRVKTGKISVE